jgi:hypothetical protein
VPIIAGGEADCAEIVSRPNLDREISERLGDSLGVLGGCTRFSRVASAPEIVALVERYPPESQLIAERVREGLGVVQMLGEPREVAEGEERGSKVEAQIDGLLECLAGRGQMLEGHQRLLEVSDRFSIRRSRERPGPGLTEVGHGLLPRLGPDRVVGEPLHELSEAVGVEPFDGLHNPSMEGTPSLREEAAVGDHPRWQLSEEERDSQRASIPSSPGGRRGRLAPERAEHRSLHVTLEQIVDAANAR